MATRISGKQTAARITAVVAVGSFTVAGLGFVALENAPTSDAATTKAGPSQDKDSSQDLGTSQNDDSSQSPSTTSRNDDESKSSDASRNDDSSQGTVVRKATVRQKAKSVVSPVKKGNGGSASGNSSGS